MGVENSIDSINLNITSSTASADEALNRLCKSLESLSTALGGVDTSGFKTKMKSIESEYDRIAQKIADNPLKIKFTIDTGKGGLQRTIDNVFKDVKLGNKDYARQIADSFNIADSKPLEDVMNSITEKMAKSFDGVKLNWDVSGFEEFEKVLKENGSVFDNYLHQMKERVENYSELVSAFWEYTRGVKIYISPENKGEYADWTHRTDGLRHEFPGRFTTDRIRSDSVKLNNIWDDLNNHFPGLFPKSIVTEGDQLRHVIELFREYKAELDGVNRAAQSTPISEMTGRSIQIAEEQIANSWGAFTDDTFKSLTEGFANQDGLGQLESFANRVKEVASELSGITVNVTGIDGIANAISKLGSQTVNSAIANIGTLSQSTNTIRQIGQDISAIGAANTEGLRSIASAFGALGRQSVTQASANIAQMQQQVPILAGLAQQISAIGATNPEGIRSLATAIGALGRKTVTAAAANIPTIATNLPRLCDALEEFITRSSQFPVVREDVVQLVTALGNLNRAGANLNNTGRTMGGILPKLNNQFKKAKTTISDIARSIRKAYSTFWVFRRLWNAGKSAVEFASDLTEVQNVVRNTFGAENEARINDFAERALDSYGMNELTAKQLASRFQAMGVALGYSQKDMTEMSENLTALAGDMASFFNVEYADVGKDLQAIFTGMTKPLRKYGVDITQATLQEWALTKGMEVNMQTMTQAQKVALRYDYVLERLALTAGDFEKTQDTWANQIRLLAENTKMLTGIWGGAFINAAKPFIKYLNGIVKSVTEFSEKVINALGVIFGWKIEITQGGITDPFEDVEIADEAADGLAGGIGDAADNAKELAKNLTVLPFDELNQLNGDTGIGADVGGGAGSGAGDAADNAADGLNTILTRVEADWTNYVSDIDNLFDLGRFISDALSTSMESIDWGATYAKLSGWGSGLADFLNGLITPRLFGNLATTIAGSINSAMSFLNGFGTTFDWTNFGRSIGTGINNYFRTIDLNLKVDNLNKFAHGILDALIKAVDTVDWDQLGAKLGEAIAQIDVGKLGGKLVELATKIIGGLLIAFAHAFVHAPFETSIITAFGAMKFLGLGSALASAIGGALNKQGFGNLIGQTIASKLGVASIIGSWLLLYGKEAPEVAEQLRKTVPGLENFNDSEILDGFGPAADLMREDNARFVDEYYQKKHQAEVAQKAWDKMQTLGAESKSNTQSKGIQDGLLKDQGEMLDAVAGLGVEAYDALVAGYTKDNNKQINDAIMGSFGSAGGITRRAMLRAMPEVIDSGALIRTKFLSSVQNGMAGSLDATGRNWVKSIITGYNSKKPELLNAASALPGEIKNRIGDIATVLLPKGTAVIDGIKSGWTNAKGGLLSFAQGLGKEINENIGDIAGTVKPKGVATMTGFITGWEEKWPTLAKIAQALNGKIKENIGNSAEALAPAGNSAVQGIASGIENGLGYIRSAAATVAENIRSRIPSNLYDEGYSAMDGYAKGMKDVNVPTPHFIMTGLKNLADDVGGFINGVKAGINLPEIGVDWYASGGYFPSPNVIGVGEAGHEAVLPLENPRAMREIANSIMGNARVDRNEMRQIMTEAFTMALMNKPNDPVNVFSTIVLENNEVLARSVSRGQRNIDYRQNPVTQTVF